MFRGEEKKRDRNPANVEERIPRESEEWLVSRVSGEAERPRGLTGARLVDRVRMARSPAVQVAREYTSEAREHDQVSPCACVRVYAAGRVNVMKWEERT